MIESPPVAPLIVLQAKLLFQLFGVVLDDPWALGRRHQGRQARVRRKVLLYAEDLLLRFHRNQPAGARKCGMIGAALDESNPRKVADAERIGGPPDDTAFGIVPLEIADQEGAEVDARGEAGSAHFLSVDMLAGAFGEPGELFFVLQFN
jgi:hypothetical protein